MKVSRQVASECRGRFQCGVNQATTNKTPLNAHNEDKVMALGEEEWEDLFGNRILKLQVLMGIHVNIKPG